MCVLGMAEEFRADGIGVNALWPRTVIATAARRDDPGRRASRSTGCASPEIVADAAHAILTRDARTHHRPFLHRRGRAARGGRHGSRALRGQAGHAAPARPVSRLGPRGCGGTRSLATDHAAASRAVQPGCLAQRLPRSSSILPAARRAALRCPATASHRARAACRCRRPRSRRGRAPVVLAPRGALPVRSVAIADVAVDLGGARARLACPAPRRLRSAPMAIAAPALLARTAARPAALPSHWPVAPLPRGRLGPCRGRGPADGRSRAGCLRHRAGTVSVVVTYGDAGPCAPRGCACRGLPFCGALGPRTDAACPVRGRRARPPWPCGRPCGLPCACRRTCRPACCHA